MRTTGRAAIVAPVAAIALLAGAGYTVASALTPAKAPSPTITAAPTTPVTATSAAFRYSDTQAGVSYHCSLDGGAFAACAASGVSYSGLADGTHTFSVEASTATLALSSPATATWRVDTIAPITTLTFPAPGAAENAGAWAAGCPTIGFCGTAIDPSGVKSVAVAVLQQSTGRYWNGTSFATTSLQLLAASGTTTWSLPMARPADGTYEVLVRATDLLGNTTPTAKLATSQFLVDTVPPAAPVITERPGQPTTSTTAEFELADSSWPWVHFSCRLDGGPLTACTGDTDHDGDRPEGEIQYTNVGRGQHCFSAYATDEAGNLGPSTSWCWTVGPGAPAALVAVSGTPQYATVGTAYALPLTARVIDAQGSPVPGVAVTFTAPSPGASAVFGHCAGGNPHPWVCVVTTNASGLAVSSVLTANGTAGSYVVTAGAAGVKATVSYSLINSVNFAVSGNLPLPLYPGTSQSLNLVLTNPNPTAITIPAGGAKIVISTTRAGCTASTNFTVAHGLTAAVAVPGNSSRSLSSLGVAQSAWPLIAMVDTHTNQNVCQGAPLTLTYSGVATG